MCDCLGGSHYRLNNLTPPNPSEKLIRTSAAKSFKGAYERTRYGTLYGTTGETRAAFFRLQNKPIQRDYVDAPVLLMPSLMNVEPRLEPGANVNAWESSTLNTEAHLRLQFK
jgi:hypothetical protein